VDIMFLLERLESLVATGTGVPATRKVLVDKDAVLELIDQLRVAVPEEIHAAKRINAEGERIIEKANDEAGRIIARAQEQATYLIGERGLTEAAVAEGRRIVAEAGEAADGVRLGADAYAAQVLESLEAEVRKALSGIEKGIGVLEQRQAELRGEPEQPDLAMPVEEASARDVEDWPEARQPVPVFEEEDAGQTVPR
jgi:cell division septum initiation protein DivIVA